jgi:hypothetical protein
MPMPSKVMLMAPNIPMRLGLAAPMAPGFPWQESDQYPDLVPDRCSHRVNAPIKNMIKDNTILMINRDCIFFFWTVSNNATPARKRQRAVLVFITILPDIIPSTDI